MRHQHGCRSRVMPATNFDVKRRRLAENLLRDILRDADLLNADVEAIHIQWDSKFVDHMKLCSQDAFLWSELCCSVQVYQFMEKTQSLALLQDLTSHLQRNVDVVHAKQVSDDVIWSDDDWLHIPSKNTE
jgi:hypothetical protein